MIFNLLVWLIHLGTKNNNKNGDIIKLQQHNLNNNDIITLALAKNVDHKCFYRWMVFENASWLKSINPHTDCNFSLYSMVIWSLLMQILNPAKFTVEQVGANVISEAGGLSRDVWAPWSTPLFVALLRFAVKNDTNDCKCVTSHSCYRYWVPKYQDWDDNSHRAFCISKNLWKQNKQSTLFSTTHQSSMNESTVYSESKVLISSSTETLMFNNQKGIFHYFLNSSCYPNPYNQRTKEQSLRTVQ